MHNHTDSIIELENVSFTYGNSTTPALSHITLDVPRGQWLTIIGHNGSGKSTLSKILAAVSAPTAGHVTLVGIPVFYGGEIDRPAYHRARHNISYVTQNPEDQIVSTTVKDDVAFEPENLGHTPHDTARLVYEALSITQMSAYADDDPNNLSGGQQQRVAISSALAAHPDILILDEPFAYVDSAAREHILNALKKAHESGTTIVLITHHAAVAHRGDRVIEMAAGHVIRDIAASDFDNVQDDSIITIDKLETSGVSTQWLAPSSNNSDIIFEARNVSYAYDRTNTVLSHMSLSIRRGEFLAVCGPNGAGKSTLMNLISGAAQPTSGTVTSSAQRIGFVMQKAEHQLFASTVREDIAYGPKNLGLSENEVKERVNETAQFLGIEHILDRTPWELSGGQQRLAAIAGVIAMKPDMLIVDEPTAGLDTTMRAKILGMLTSLHERGTTVVMISHSLEDICAYADRAIVLNPATDILGQVSHADTQCTSTPQSRFDPRIITVFSILATFSMFAVTSWWQLALASCATVLYACTSRIPFRKLIRELHGFWIFIVCLAVFNLFFVQTGHEIKHWGILRITDDGCMASVLYAARFTFAGVIAISMLHMLPANRMTDAVEHLARPLKKLGVPVHQLALTGALTIRFLPILVRDFKSLATAQSLRGSQILHGSISSRLRSAQALLVPTFAAALRHADKLSMALDTRGFDSDAQRVPWRQMKVTWRDYIFIGVFVFYVTGLIALAFV